MSKQQIPIHCPECGNERTVFVLHELSNDGNEIEFEGCFYCCECGLLFGLRSAPKNAAADTIIMNRKEDCVIFEYVNDFKKAMLAIQSRGCSPGA